MLNTKGLVALTEHQRVGRWLIRAENWDNKNYKRQTSKGGQIIDQSRKVGWQKLQETDIAEHDFTF